MDYLKLVEELNQEICDKHGETGRKWIEKKNDYEPMKPFIKQELKKYGKN